MNEYGTAVLRTAFFYLGDRHLAEDVSQEVFIRAYRNWTRFRGESHVKTWLTKITINVCRDKAGLKSSSEQPMDPVLMKQPRGAGVEEEAMKRMEKTVILRHVMSLPAPYHEVIYLYYYMELSTTEIAEVTGTPEGTVRGRLHRAREALGQILKQEGMSHGSS
ncbi:RNA polymerase subunit sigma [Xylanibacillus composti]|nr:RNA polymerase subunit sigma [Xylanibacillus composti]